MSLNYSMTISIYLVIMTHTIIVLKKLFFKFDFKEEGIFLFVFFPSFPCALRPAADRLVARISLSAKIIN